MSFYPVSPKKSNRNPAARRWRCLKCLWQCVECVLLASWRFLTAKRVRYTPALNLENNLVDQALWLAQPRDTERYHYAPETPDGLRLADDFSAEEHLYLRTKILEMED